MSDSAPWDSDPNGPAYAKEERRIGPPLDYVGEKQRSALDSLHVALVAARASSSTELGGVGAAASQAFGYQVAAYLALYNMLGVHTGRDYIERLELMNRENFERWLAFIEREGSISGK